PPQARSPVVRRVAARDARAGATSVCLATHRGALAPQPQSAPARADAPGGTQARVANRLPGRLARSAPALARRPRGRGEPARRHRTGLGRFLIARAISRPSVSPPGAGLRLALLARLPWPFG